MRKTKPERPSLKATSLSDLRLLRQQATQQAQDSTPNDVGLGSVRASTDSSKTGDSSGRRKAHRFFPPGRGVLSDQERQKNVPTGVETGSSGPGSGGRTRTGAAGTAAAGAFDASASEASATLDKDDVALFRRVVQSVTPARASNRALLPPVPAATPAQLSQRRLHAMGQAIHAALDVSDHYTVARIHHDNTEFLQAGHDPHLVKGLKKGKWSVQASLDLHGANLDEARERMDRFIQSCRDHQIRCVRIVHGKGHGSHNGDAVLKETVRRWLSQLAVVLAYVECAEPDGGAGAVLALLSKKDA